MNFIRELHVWLEEMYAKYPPIELRRDGNLNKMAETEEQTFCFPRTRADNALGCDLSRLDKELSKTIGA